MSNVLNVGKRALSVGVVVSTMFWSVGAAAFLPAMAQAATTCPTFKPGDMLKVNDIKKPAVYSIDNKGNLLYFPSGYEFKSWNQGEDYPGVNLVSQDCFDALPVPQMAPFGVNFRAGSYVVKRASSDQLYVVEPNNMLAKITPDAAKALYGASFKPMVIQDVFWPNYGTTRGADVTENKVHPGMLVSNGGKTWYVSTDMKLQEVTSAGMTANRFKAAFVRPVTAAQIAGLSTGDAINAEIPAISDRSQTGGVAQTPSTPAQTGSVSVALSADTPGTNTIVSGQAVADLAHFTFSGNGTVTVLKLQRTGISADATLSNIYLYDGNTRLTDTASAVNGVITFANSSGLFTVSGSRTISVKADIAANHSGETLGVAVTDLTANGTAVSGLNVAGNNMTIASATLAGLTISTVSPSGSTNVNAGTTNYTVWSAPLTISTRALTLKHLTLKMIGSAPMDALTNYNLYLNGTQIASNPTIDNNNQLVNFDFPAGVTMQTGNATLEVRADVVKGSNRTFSFSLQNASDLVAVDSNYNVPVSASSGVPATTATVSVNAGSVTVSLDPSFSDTTVVGGSSNVTVASYLLKAFGEDVKITSLTVTPNRNLDNVALFANNAQVGNTQSYTGTALTYSLGSSLIIPAGQTVTLQVKADTKASSVNVTTGTIQVALSGAANNAQGVTSANLATVPAGSTSGPALTVSTAGLTVVASPSFLNQTVTGNVQHQKIGSYTIQAGSSEGVNITNLAVTLNPTTISVNDLSNLTLSLATTTPVNPQSTNNFPVNLTLAAGQSMTIDVFADIGNKSAGSVYTTLTITATGVTSRSSVSSPAVTGQTVTLGTGSLPTPTLTSASAQSQLVIGGKDFPVATYNFVATTSPITIDELGFAVTSSIGQNAVTAITVNGVTAPVLNFGATTTNLGLVIPVGFAGKDVVVTPSFNNVGLNGVTSNQAVTTTLTYIKYHIGTTVTTSSVSVASNGMTLVGGKPGLSVTRPAGVTLQSGSNLTHIADVNVSADTGAVTLTALPVTISGTGNVFMTSSTSNIVVKDASGATIPTTQGNLGFVAGSSSSTIVSFTGGYKIDAGTTKQFQIWATVSGVSGSAGTQAVSFSLGSKSLFTWTDVVGNVSGITGAAIFNYPADSVSVSN